MNYVQLIKMHFAVLKKNKSWSLRALKMQKNQHHVGMA